MPRKRKNGYAALEGEDDDATWTSWKFCTGDRIRELLHGEPAANAELRALGLVEAFSRTYSRPVLKSVIEFARVFKKDGDSCMFRGRKIKYGKEEMRRVFSLPSGLCRGSLSGPETVQFFKKQDKSGKPTCTFSIESLEEEFKSWAGPIRAVQELLLGKRIPTQVNGKQMWYFSAHHRCAFADVDWADLIQDSLKREIKNLQNQLKRNPTEARAGAWEDRRYPVFCGTAMMAILTHNGFSEDELSSDWKEHVTSTRRQRSKSRKRGSSTIECDEERNYREPATIEPGRKAKRRRRITEVHKRKSDLEGIETLRAVTRQMAKRRKDSAGIKHDPKSTAKVMAMIVRRLNKRKSSRKNNSTRTKRDLEVCKVMAMKIALRYKRKKSSRSKMVAYSGLANTQGAGEAILQHSMELCEDDEMQGTPEGGRHLGESIDQELLWRELDSMKKKHTEEIEKLNKHVRLQAGLLKTQDKDVEYRKKLLESQEVLHTEQMAKIMNEDARLQAGVQRAKEEIASLEKQKELHADEMGGILKENAKLQDGLRKAEEEVFSLRNQNKEQEELYEEKVKNLDESLQSSVGKVVLLNEERKRHAREILEKKVVNARLQAELQKAKEEAVELQKKLSESQVKTRNAYASSHVWKDTWEGASKALEEAKAEIQNLTLRVGSKSTAHEIAENMKKKLEDDNALLRQQLRRQSAILEGSWDEAAPENWNDGSPTAQRSSEPSSCRARKLNVLTAGPSGAHAAPKTMEANVPPKSESHHDS